MPALLREGFINRLATRRVLAAASIVTLALVVWLIGSRPFVDLAVYRFGVHNWLDGGNLYGSFLATDSGISLPFNYPPFAALALSPFALVPWGVSWAAMVFLSVSALTAVIYVTVRRLWQTGPRRARLMLTAAAVPLSLLLSPVGWTISLGQINLLLMALVTLDCLAAKPRWPRGMLVGIAAAIKLTPAAFVLFFLVAKDLRAMATAAATFVAAMLVGFAVAPGSSWQYWTGSAKGLGGTAQAGYPTNQGIHGELARIHGLEPFARSAIWLTLCVVVLAVVLLGMRSALRNDNRAAAMVINAGGALLVSPISWAHHWVYVVPALLVMAGHALRTPNKRWAIVAAVAAVLFVLAPYRFLPNSEFLHGWWQHLVANSYVLLTLILLVSAAWPEMRWLRPAAWRTAPIRGSLIAPSKFGTDSEVP